MALRFVLDEHLRGLLWNAIRQHNAAGAYPIDAMRVGDPPDLPSGTQDPDLLIWAEREGRLIVTNDRKTMRPFLTQHLLAGRSSPGVLLIPSGYSFAQIVFDLALIAHAGDPLTYQDDIRFMP